MPSTGNQVNVSNQPRFIPGARIVSDMGWEVELNAIPAKCTLLEAVTRNDISEELLTFVRTYFRFRRRQQRRVEEFVRYSSEYEIFVDALEDMVVSHPGIEYRYCDLDRRFDWLGWLLVHCAQRDDEKQIAVEAIRGEYDVSPSAHSVQGFPIRMTSPGKVELIDVWLSELRPEDLKRQYDPEKMNRAGLYKWGAPVDPEATLGWILEDFASLQLFYHAVTSQSEAVLVVMD
jgi:hypothetical protein